MNKFQLFITKFKTDKKFRNKVLFFVFYPFNFSIRMIIIYYYRFIDRLCKDVIIFDYIDAPKEYIDHTFIKFVDSKMNLKNCIITITTRYHLETFDESIDGNCTAMHDCKSATISINPKLFEMGDKAVYFVIFHELVHLEQLHQGLIKFSFPFGFDSQSQDHFWKGELIDVSNVTPLNYNLLPWEEHANNRAEILLDEFIHLQKQFHDDPKLFM